MYGKWEAIKRKGLGVKRGSKVFGRTACNAEVGKNKDDWTGKRRGGK